MLTRITVLVATAVAAHAASSSASASAAPAATPALSPYIPTSGISTSCSVYLATLDTDSDLSVCTSALNTAVASFAPPASSASSSSVSSALSTVCSSATTGSCSQSLLTGKLAAFHVACGPELTGSSPNAEVKGLYDTFYTLLPLIGSVCAKDDAGAYCVLSKNGTTSASPAGLLASSSSSSAPTPNAATIDSGNLLFLALSPSLSVAQLCTSCTRAVLTSFISFESDTAYAPGLGQSAFISGQPALYASIMSKCGSNFMTHAVQAAGGLGQGSSGVSAAVGGARAGAAALLLGSVGVVAALLV